MRLISFGLSDIGLGRSNNEDVWGALPEKGFFALADGMGGRKAGEIAAKETVESLLDSVRKITTIDCMEWIIELRHAIEKANRTVYQKGKNSTDFLGMGTTLCCLLWTKEAVIYAHIGDSRIYRYRKKKLQLLTQDHSLFNKWLATRPKTCSTSYPYKNVITRALGTAERARPEIAVTSYEPEDLYLLCTDGLSDVLTFQEMESLIDPSQSLSEICKNFITKAKIKGGSDNMTLLMIRDYR